MTTTILSLPSARKASPMLQPIVDSQGQFGSNDFGAGRRAVLLSSSLCDAIHVHRSRCRSWCRFSLTYSGVPHIRFLFWGEGSLWILGFGVPSRPNPSSGVAKSTLPVPRERSSILNVDLVVMSAAVHQCRLSTTAVLVWVDKAAWASIVYRFSGRRFSWSGVG